jgi:hypothetical protein
MSRPRGLVLIALVLVGAGCGPASQQVKLVAVSGKSPFRSCTVQAPLNDPRGRLIVDSEVEPFIAVDPGHPQILIGVYQQDRWTDGQARGIVASVSHDGGKHWRQIPLPLSECARASLPFPRVGDPWVSIGPDGTAYAMGSGDGIVVTTSHDGGLHWDAPSILDESTRQYFADKPMVTADPRKAGVAYAVWARLIHATDAPPILSDAAFAKTTDFGRTWTPPSVLIEHTMDTGAVVSQILASPDGSTLYHLTNWEEGDLPGPQTPSKMVIQSSADGGRTWTKPTAAITDRTAGYRPLDRSRDFVRTAVEGQDFAIDPSSGALYAVWQDARFSGGRYDEVALSRSTDGGRTWSAPIKVNQSEGRLAAIPSVAVNAHGDIGVAYYTFGSGSAGTRAAIDAEYFLAVSRDAGMTFSTTKLAGPVDIRHAPQALATGGMSGYFLGDYIGLDATGSAFVTLFSLPNSSTRDPADVYFANSG